MKFDWNNENVKRNLKMLAELCNMNEQELIEKFETSEDGIIQLPKPTLEHMKEVFRKY